MFPGECHCQIDTACYAFPARLAFLGELDFFSSELFFGSTASRFGPCACITPAFAILIKGTSIDGVGEGAIT